MVSITLQFSPGISLHLENKRIAAVGGRRGPLDHKYSDILPLYPVICPLNLERDQNRMRVLAPVLSRHLPFANNILFSSVAKPLRFPMNFKHLNWLSNMRLIIALIRPNKTDLSNYILKWNYILIYFALNYQFFL